MSDLRDKIARALHRQATDDGEVHVLWGGVSEHEEEVAEWLPFADAVLAVLADLPESVIERAARAIDPAAWDESLWQDGGRVCVLPESVGAAATRDDVKGEVREAFRAAFGGEQSDD